MVLVGFAKYGRLALWTESIRPPYICIQVTPNLFSYLYLLFIFVEYNFWYKISDRTYNSGQVFNYPYVGFLHGCKKIILLIIIRIQN